MSFQTPHADATLGPPDADRSWSASSAMREIDTSSSSWERAPRKRRTTVSAAAPSSVVARRREFYAGADLEAFFAAHDL